MAMAIDWREPQFCPHCKAICEGIIDLRYHLDHYCPGTTHIKYTVVTRFSDGLNTMVPVGRN